MLAGAPWGLGSWGSLTGALGSVMHYGDSSCKGVVHRIRPQAMVLVQTLSAWSPDISGNHIK